MNCIKITISGQDFLLPEPNNYDNYEFPTFIHENLVLLRDFIQQANIALEKWKKDPLNDYFKNLPDVQYFKDRTGIIGIPFDAKDVQLYVANNPQLNIIMEVSFDGK